MMQTFYTLGDFCRLVPLSAPTARLYADSGLIDNYRDSQGHRLFPPEAVEQAINIKETRKQRQYSAKFLAIKLGRPV